MPGSTSRCWNGAACAWWTGRGRSCARPLRRAGARRSRGDRIGSAAADGGERAGGARRRPSAARPAVDPGWARGRAALARRRLMAARRPACRGGVPGGAARDPARQGGALGDGGQDRSPFEAARQPRSAARTGSFAPRTMDARGGIAQLMVDGGAIDGLVPPGAPQVAAGAGGPDPSGRAQAAAGQAARYRAQHPRRGHLPRSAPVRSGPLLEGPPRPWRRLRSPWGYDAFGTDRRRHRRWLSLALLAPIPRAGRSGASLSTGLAVPGRAVRRAPRPPRPLGRWRRRSVPQTAADRRRHPGRCPPAGRARAGLAPGGAARRGEKTPPRAPPSCLTAKVEVRDRSRGRTRKDAAAAGSGRPPRSACSRRRSGSGRP